MGSRLIPILRSRGHHIKALVRDGSHRKLPYGCEPVPGDALDGRSYEDRVHSCDTFIHLVGVAHPGPAKAREFVTIDQRSAMEAVGVAHNTGIAHFIYLSVAQPAPVMQAYVAVRANCEAAIRAAGLTATILRPWYVLGPGHRWPYVLIPLYRLAELCPSARDGARRLGLVTIDQMLNALAASVENKQRGLTILDVPAIRAVASGALCL